MANKIRHRGWGHIRRLPSGRYQASYVEQKNRMIRHNAPMTFSAKVDAEHWLANARREMERGSWTPPAQRSAERMAKMVTLAAYAENWIAERKLGKRTREGYEPTLRLHIAPTALGGSWSATPGTRCGATSRRRSWRPCAPSCSSADRLTASPQISRYRRSSPRI